MWSESQTCIALDWKTSLLVLAEKQAWYALELMKVEARIPRARTLGNCTFGTSILMMINHDSWANSSEEKNLNARQQGPVVSVG